MAPSPSQVARQYVRNAVLPAAPPPVLGPRTRSAFAFETAKEQAAVVGSEVIAFVKGITDQQRQDIVNATLLAQLVAKKKVPDPETLDEVIAWYQHYFDVLSNIGFVVQDRGFAEFVETSQTFEAHKAILEIAATLLAGSPSALLLVTKTLESLEKMGSDSPWITLFHREGRTGQTARFQVSLVSADETGPFLVSLIAFGLEAQATLTQVLFFKFSSSQVRLRHNSGKVTINAELLSLVRQDIADKLKAHLTSFVAGLDV